MGHFPTPGQPHIIRTQNNTVVLVCLFFSVVFVFCLFFPFFLVGFNDFFKSNQLDNNILQREIGGKLAQVKYMIQNFKPESISKFIPENELGLTLIYNIYRYCG